MCSSNTLVILSIGTSPLTIALYIAAVILSPGFCLTTSLPTRNTAAVILLLTSSDKVDVIVSEVDISSFNFLPSATFLGSRGASGTTSPFFGLVTSIKFLSILLIVSLSALFKTSSVLALALASRSFIADDALSSNFNVFNSEGNVAALVIPVSKNPPVAASAVSIKGLSISKPFSPFIPEATLVLSFTTP